MPIPRLAVLLLLLVSAGHAFAQGRPTVGLFTGDLVQPGMATAAADMGRDLAAAGLEVRRIDADALSNTSRMTRDALDLILYPAGRAYPAAAVGALQGYLKSGGRLIVLGGPPFSQPAWRIGDGWMTWDAFRRRLAEAPPEHVILDFNDPSDAEGWSRATNTPQAPGRLSVGDYGSGHGTSLQVDIGNLTGWDTWSRPVSGLLAGRQLFAFWAKGSERTSQMSFELRERDGSRWMAVVPLTPRWEYYALGPGDFRYWHDNPSVGRGGPGDHVRFENVELLATGLAYTHTQVPGGAHRYWLDEVAFRPDPRPEEGEQGSLVLDGLTPDYKLFPVRGATLARAAAQTFVPAGRYPLPRDLISVSPRPFGTGFGKGRSLRFVPLIEARDARGRRSGYVAWLHLNGEGDWAGSAWAAFGSNDPSFYRQAAVRKAITQLARSLAGRPYLYEGGSQRFAYHSDAETVTLGCRVVEPSESLAGEPHRTVRVTIAPLSGSRPVFTHTWDVDGGDAAPSDATWPGARVRRFSTPWTPTAAARSGGRFRVTTELLQGGRRLDVLSHELSFWKPKPQAQRRYVTARGGDFWLNGRRWAPHGLNYMPSSGIALEDGQVFEHWIGARGYDPAIIQEDLERVAALGMNSISVFVYHGHHREMNVLDLLMRADRLGLKVNLSLRPYADPLHFRWNEVRDMISDLRLAQSDTLFTYDLAWERGFGTYEPSYSNVLGRKAYDPQWRLWIAEQYGSVEAAERDWGYPARRLNGSVVGPSDDQVSTDGPWRRMVAAYRRFADDFISRAYGRAARQIRSIDPHHLISFRMTMAGDPTLPPREFPYDFRGLARALDLMEPEGYGRLGDWPRVRDGAFTATYSRYAAPGRPVYWAEFGQSAWAGSNFQRPNPGLDTQGRLYDSFYRMIALSRANGSAAWWFPGGFRVGENSDFGLFNPDWTDRPDTVAARRWLPRLLALGRQPRPRVDVWFTVDRDADARGLFAIYEKLKDRYWQALEAGKTPGLRDAGSGTTSANAPLLAVGGTPYSGHNPPRYLNAEFDRLEVKDASGRWVDVTGGILKSGEAPVVTVAAGRPVQARAVVGNTQVATWLAPRGGRGAPGRTTPAPARGTVVLATTPDSTLRMPSPVPISQDVPDLGTARIGPFILTRGVSRETPVSLRMTAWGRMWFGEKVSFTLRPAPPR